jgi:hypothetical protein
VHVQKTLEKMTVIGSVAKLDAQELVPSGYRASPSGT